MAKRSAAATTERKPRAKKTTPATSGEFADAIQMTASPAVDRAPGTLPGFTSSELHPEIVEAIKAFDKARDHYASACASINGQYLNALVNSPAADQVAALRALF